jgi:hypothetical protein
LSQIGKVTAKLNATLLDITFTNRKSRGDGALESAFAVIIVSHLIGGQGKAFSYLTLVPGMNSANTITS